MASNDITKTLEKYLGKNWLWTILGTITIIIIMYAIFWYEAHDPSREILDAETIDMQLNTGAGAGGAGEGLETKIGSQSFQGSAPPLVEEKLTLKEEMVENVTFVLQWADDEPLPGSGLIWTNEPDEMTLTVTSPADKKFSETKKNPQGENGVIEITVGADEVLTGEWTITIDCEPGAITGPLGTERFVDEGAQYDLNVEWEYLVQPQ